MITALKKIYVFSGRWKGVLKKTVVFSLLHSIFDMFQIGALFLILNGLVEGLHGQDIIFAFLLLLAGVIGKIICSYISDFSQTRVGYFMCADKRIHVGDRMKYMPMGYFNSHSLGNLTSTVTTTISDVENNAPSVLITVIHGFIHVVVITIVIFFLTGGSACWLAWESCCFCSAIRSCKRNPRKSLQSGRQRRRTW